ncbi:MAG: acyltransferase family protein, partial [Sphingomonadaceae bacterium]
MNAPVGVMSRAHLSDAITVSRILCMTSVVWVHAWFGMPRTVMSGADAVAQMTMVTLLADVLGRSSVPLLSIVSGYLVSVSWAKANWASFV